MAIAEVAELFGVGTTFVNKLRRLHRDGADLAPRPHGAGQTARLSVAHHKLLRAEVRRRTDATLVELRSHVAEQARMEVSLPTLGRVPRQLGLGRKKSA
ncbi:MAG: hypothetical protein H0T45_00635 [Pyrinomonadaceae bacterium]|nr:hypothetical protein [Pyrinomonadaceae bacterium]MDQ3257407.1 hypothetical protein [Acidobacteriota bacterium]